MDFRQMNRRIFAGQPIPHPLFQPRMEPWYAWHRDFHQLPSGAPYDDLRRLYDDLGLSMRYVHYYTGRPNPVLTQYGDGVRVEQRLEPPEGTRVYATPHGDLVSTLRYTIDRTWRVVGFPVKRIEDLRALRWLFERTEYAFSSEAFAEGDQFIGPRGEPQFWVPKSPYQALAQQWMKLEDLIYLLADHREAVEDTMKAIDASYDRLYEEMIASDQIRIVNFGENIHDQLLSPRYFERYLIPFYEKRSGQLRRAGIYTHVHIDGFFHSLLPYLRDLPFDGYEALTPQPQGDVPLEQIAEQIGDKVLLDGIPAVLFMPQYSPEELMTFVERVVALFHPRLVLGISDELPEGTGLEALERVRAVSDWCRGQRTVG